MDQKEADHIIDQTANQTHNYYLKKTLQFLIPISIISFLFSYFSIFNLLIFHPLQFYASIFPILSQALDRNCMFLICNGILAFLANNSSLMNHGGSMKSFNNEDNLAFQGNAASLEYVVGHTREEKEIIKVQEEEEDDEVYQNAAEEIERGEVRLEREEWGEEDDEVDDDEIEGHIENSSIVSEMRVSTEELNKKFDEFIRKMKEEIRIEARQQYLIVV